jgi:hypothetical protein
MVVPKAVGSWLAHFGREFFTSGFAWGDWRRVLASNTGKTLAGWFTSA